MSREMRTAGIRSYERQWAPMVVQYYVHIACACLFTTHMLGTRFACAQAPILQNERMCPRSCDRVHCDEILPSGQSDHELEVNIMQAYYGVWLCIRSLCDALRLLDQQRHQQRPKCDNDEICAIHDVHLPFYLRLNHYNRTGGLSIDWFLDCAHITVQRLERLDIYSPVYILCADLHSRLPSMQWMMRDPCMRQVREIVMSIFPPTATRTNQSHELRKCGRKIWTWPASRIANAMSDLLKL